MTTLGKIGAFLLGGLVAAATVAAPREQVATDVTQRQSPPKPTGPIAVGYRFVAAPEVGRPLDVVITARVSQAVGLALEATAADPAALVVVAQTSGLDRDGERTWVVTVVPLLARASYLDVLVTGEIDGVPQARNVVVAIRTDVGAAGAAAAAGDAAAGAGGERLILLPVDERP